MNICYSVQVDWDDDGVFTGTDEDLTLKVRGTPGILVERGNDQLQDLSPPMAAYLSWDVDNINQHFSVANASSPIYSNLHPGHFSRVKIDSLKIIINYTTTSSGNLIVVKPTIAAPTTYTVQAGDILVYDILWTTGTDAVWLDLSDGISNHLFYDSLIPAYKDQNGYLAASSNSYDIAGVATNQFYTRYIKLDGSPSMVGSTIFPVIMSRDYAALVKTVTGYIQNAYIINGNTIKFVIARTFETLNFTTPVATNANITGTDLAQHNYLCGGYVDDLPQNSNPEQLSVTIPSLGTLSRLKGQLITTQLYQNITTDQALSHILDACGIPISLRGLTIGSTTLLWWWLNNEDAFNAAVNLVVSEGPGAKLFDSSVGAIGFQGRAYRSTQTRPTVSNGTFTSSGNSPNFVRPFRFNPGMKDVVNLCQATVVTRALQALGVVWTYGSGSVTLAPNESWTVLASASNPFLGALVPVATIDYIITSGSVTTVSIDKTSGQTITIVMTAGASGAVFNSLQLRAQALTVQTTTTVNQTLDTGVSQTKYGKRSYLDNILQDISINDAQDLVNGIVSVYQNPRPVVSVDVMLKDYITYQQLTNRGISDRITINDTQSGFNGDVWIEYIKHLITAAGIQWKVTYGTEQVWTNPYAVWDSALWDTGVFGF